MCLALVFGNILKCCPKSNTGHVSVHETEGLGTGRTENRKPK